MANDGRLSHAAKQVPTNLVLTLHDDSVGVLPQLTTGALHQLVGDMRRHGVSGFCTRQWMISDHDLCVAYLSRASWDVGATPAAVYEDLLRAVCGEAAVGPLLEAFRELERVTTALEDHGMGLTFAAPGMLMQSWSPGELSKKLREDGEAYRRILNAVRLVPVPPREEGKAYVQYWLGRLEFAVGYFDTLEAVKRAATAAQAAAEARKKGDQPNAAMKSAEALQQAQLAQTTAFQAVEAFAQVAKNQADRGAVATLAEYVDRPLKRKVEELRAAAGRRE